MSYATFTARTVAKACENWIAALAEDIDRQKQELIRKAMSEPRWFGRKRSREEAIAYLSGTEFGISEMELAEMYLWKDKEDVMALLALSKKATSDVHVSANDAYILQRFL